MVEYFRKQSDLDDIDDELDETALLLCGSALLLLTAMLFVFCGPKGQQQVETEAPQGEVVEKVQEKDEGAEEPKAEKEENSADADDVSAVPADEPKEGEDAKGGDEDADADGQSTPEQKNPDDAKNNVASADGGDDAHGESGAKDKSEAELTAEFAKELARTAVKNRQERATAAKNKKSKKALPDAFLNNSLSYEEEGTSSKMNFFLNNMYKRAFHQKKTFFQYLDQYFHLCHF